MPARKAKKAKPGKGPRKLGVVTAPNDNLSQAIDDLVPEKYRGTDRYLDVVQWNIEWFGAAKSRQKDKQRRDLILQILGALNGDLFIFQEVAGPSKDGRYPGVLDSIADELTQEDFGEYVVAYTRAGGEQRVAMMWDRDFLRAKTDVEELFSRGTYSMPDGSDPFATRTPLHGYFSARLPEAGGGGTADAFDFQVLGVHLKAMGSGHPQRLESAKILARWLTDEAPKMDTDTLIMGDWNAGPDSSCWKPFHDLENQGKVGFRKINDPSDYSYLWLDNKQDKFLSRIDLTLASVASMTQVVGDAAHVIKWKPIEEALAIAGNYKDAEVIKVLKQAKETISDHLPTVTRFYFTERKPG